MGRQRRNSYVLDCCLTNFIVVLLFLLSQLLWQPVILWDLFLPLSSAILEVRVYHRILIAFTTGDSDFVLFCIPFETFLSIRRISKNAFLFGRNEEGCRKLYIIFKKFLKSFSISNLLS